MVWCVLSHGSGNPADGRCWGTPGIISAIHSRRRFLSGRAALTAREAAAAAAEAGVAAAAGGAAVEAGEAVEAAAEADTGFRPFETELFFAG